jgi:hypothetical protein
MSGEMQENSDIAVRLASEETRAGGITTYVLWRAEASLQMERMVSALVTASREANNLFREVSYCSHDPRFDTERDIPDVETSNWRAVCGKTASTVRREGRREPLPYPYQAAPDDADQKNPRRSLARHRASSIVATTASPIASPIQRPSPRNGVRNASARPIGIPIPQ